MTKSDEQYRQELSEIEYRVTRHAATEPPFTGRYWDHWDEGRYHCVCCGTPLFISSTKFDAGCGWPSYHTPFNTEVISEHRDVTHGMIRTEVKCSKCDCRVACAIALTLPLYALSLVTMLNRITPHDEISV